MERSDIEEAVEFVVRLGIEIDRGWSALSEKSVQPVSGHEVQLPEGKLFSSKAERTIRARGLKK